MERQRGAQHLCGPRHGGLAPRVARCEREQCVRGEKSQRHSPPAPGPAHRRAGEEGRCGRGRRRRRGGAAVDGHGGGVLGRRGSVRVAVVPLLERRSTGGELMAEARSQQTYLAFRWPTQASNATDTPAGTSSITTLPLFLPIA